METLETDKTQERDSQELKVQGKGGTYYAPTHGHMPPCLLGRCSGVDGEAMPGWGWGLGLRIVHRRQVLSPVVPRDTHQTLHHLFIG